MEYIDYKKEHIPHLAIDWSLCEMLTEKLLSLNHARVFWCPAFVYNESPKSKVHARAQPGILLSSDDHGVYTVEPLESREYVISVYMTFDKTSLLAPENNASSLYGGDDDWSGQKNLIGKTHQLDRKTLILLLLRALTPTHLIMTYSRIIFQPTVTNRVNLIIYLQPLNQLAKTNIPLICNA